MKKKSELPKEPRRNIPIADDIWDDLEKMAAEDMRDRPRQTAYLIKKAVLEWRKRKGV
jgi:hypothetical protein